MAKCRAPVFVGTDRPLEIREFELPDLRDGEILLRMQMAGICGTDVHAWHNPKTPSPLLFGHEIMGEVEKVGNGKIVDGVGQEVQVGDTLVFAGFNACYSCYTCTVAKDPTRCENRMRYGFSLTSQRPQLSGGYGEFLHLLPGAGVVKVPEKMPADKAFLATIGNHTLQYGLERIGGISVGDTVVVQGTGPIGLAAVIQAKANGAGRIIVVGAPEIRLELARTLGANDTVSIEKIKDPEERATLVRELTGGHGADIVIEASGGSTAVAEGIRMARINGKYLIIGQATDYGPKPINPFLVTFNELKLFGSWTSESRHLYRALQTLRDLDLPVEKLISHRFSLAEATKGLETVDRFGSVVGVIQHDL